MDKKKFFITWGITFFTLLVIVIVSFVMLSFSGKGNELDFLDKQSSSSKNILVVGVDKDGTRADVIMLICTNPKDKEISVISVPRDTRVALENGKYSKINACLGRKNGDALLTDRVRDLTGLPVHSFCKVTFEGLRNVFDILGGVEYNVPIDMDYDDPAQDLHIHLKAGPQHLDGADIEGLLRFRSGYATADLGRIDTQQDFLKETIKQKLKLKYVFKIPAVMREVEENFYTDLSGFDVLSLAWRCKGCSFDSIILPGEPKMIGGVSYYIADVNAPVEIEALLGKSTATPGDLNDKVIE